MKRIGAWFKDKFSRFMDILGRFRLMTTLIIVVVVCAALFSTSLLLSNHIAKGLIHSEYEEYNATIFHQAKTAISNSIQDLTQLCYTMMSSSAVVEYLEASSFQERSSLMDSLKTEFDRLTSLQGDIKGIFLFSLDGKMIASAGKGSLPSAVFQEVNSVSFSGRCSVDNRDFFSVHVPIYDLSSSRTLHKIGYCQLMVSMNFLQKSIEELLPNPDYFCLITSAKGEILLKEGEIDPELLNELLYMDERSEPEGQVLYQADISRTPWQILFGISQAQLFSSINLLQKNYFVTYVILGLLLLLLFVTIYASVLRPIYLQIHFMTYYAKNRTSRMKNTAHNEMGELANHMNQMLDDIDQLTAENVRAQQRILEAQYQKKQSELFAYRNQVNPHFLRNTFETIRGMALYHHADDIASITSSLSDLFSYNLMGKGYAPIHEIQAHIENYKSIISYRFRNRYTIEMDIAPETMDVLFPKMVIQPLVENSIFHGLETVETSGTVSVFIRLSPDQRRLLLTVADNGLGITPEDLKMLEEERLAYDSTNDFPTRKHGVGIINIYRRLKLFYGKELIFSINSSYGHGTQVDVNVPCEIQNMEDRHVSGFFD